MDLKIHNTEAENKLLRHAQERFEIARSQKVDHRGRPLNEKFSELDKIYRGDQWKEVARPHKSQPVLNFTFSLVESVVPRVVDNNPEILVISRDHSATDPLAKMLGTLQGYLWYINKMKKQTTEAVRMAMKYGTVFFKITWNPDLYDGLGEVQYSTIHPMNFYPDPRAYEIEDMDYCFVAVPKSLEYFARTFPDKGNLVIPDFDWQETEQIQGAAEDSGESVALLKEYWFRDKDGTMCCMYYAGDLVLKIIGGEYDKSTKDQPVYLHNKFPFAKLVDYNMDKEFWGMGEVELIFMVQRLVNSFEAQIIDNTRLMSNAQWVVNKVQSGLDEEDTWIFDDKPGSVIWTYNGGVEKQAGTPIPGHIAQHQERLIFSMEQILGVHDVVQGRRPSGVRAASAIIALQESANIRVRQKADNLAITIREIAEQANWLILENYEEERRIRISGQQYEYVTLNVREALDERLLESAKKAGEVAPMSATIDEFTEEQREDIRQIMKFPEFDIEIHVGPAVPYSQALLYEQAKEFFSLGIIDRRAVLELTNFPGREDILKRMEAQEAAAQEQAMQEEQMAAGEQGAQATMPM